MEAIRAQEKTIGAFVCRAENARAASSGPLRGIAVGIKDIIDTADFPTEMGSRDLQRPSSAADAPVVMALKQAGATIIGKTTTTAFAANDPTATLNPHNHGAYAGRIVVGLGGGGRGRDDPAGAGHADRRLGDPAGVVLRRAAIKPRYRLLPTVGVKCLFLDAGHGRTVRGRRRRPRAGACGHDQPAGTVVPQAVATPRIGVVTQEFAGAPEASGAEALRKAARAAEQAGASVRELAMPEMVAEAWRIHPSCRNSRRIRRSPGNTGRTTTRCRRCCAAKLDESEGITPADYDAARGVALRARPALAQFSTTSMCC